MPDLELDAPHLPSTLTVYQSLGSLFNIALYLPFLDVLNFFDLFAPSVSPLQEAIPFSFLCLCFPTHFIAPASTLTYRKSIRLQNKK
jgi:hypothetical protein